MRVEHRSTLTKKREKLLMLANAVTRNGYSVASICPSSKLMSSCGLVDDLHIFADEEGSIRLYLFK